MQIFDCIWIAFDEAQSRQQDISDRPMLGAPQAINAQTKLFKPSESPGSPSTLRCNPIAHLINCKYLTRPVRTAKRGPITVFHKAPTWKRVVVHSEKLDESQLPTPQRGVNIPRNRILDIFPKLCDRIGTEETRAYRGQTQTWQRIIPITISFRISPQMENGVRKIRIVKLSISQSLYKVWECSHFAWNILNLSIQFFPKIGRSADPNSKFAMPKVHFSENGEIRNSHWNCTIFLNLLPTTGKREKFKLKFYNSSISQFPSNIGKLGYLKFPI